MFESSKSVDGAGPNVRRTFSPSKRLKAAHRVYRKNGGTASLTGFARAIRSKCGGETAENAAHLWLAAKGR